MNADILRHISDLLPPDCLYNASTTHPVFFERWMRMRYRSLEFSTSNKETKVLWAHIRDNEQIAALVNDVLIRPWLVQPRTQTYQSWTENAFNRLAALLDPDYLREQAEHRFQKRIRKDIGRVQATLFSLKNVKHYRVEWDSREEYHAELFTAFLHPVLQKWSGNLVSLSLHIPIHMLASFARTALPSLQRIDFCLDTGKLEHREISYYLDGFLVFLHNLKDSLQALSIQSTPTSENLDLSRLYRLLGNFPHLRAVALAIPFDGAQLSNPNEFCKFLRRHSETLEELTLGTTRCSVHVGPVDPQCVHWIQTIINSIQTPFPCLQRIKLALRPLKAPLSLLSLFLRLHAATLKSVALTDRTLDLDEIRYYIIAPLSGAGGTNPRSIPLKNLEIRVHVLSPKLLHLLASSLPCLHTLKLDLADSPRNVHLFRTEMRRLDCSKWELRRLIMSPGPNASWISVLEKVLVECIPALSSVEELQPPA